MTDKIRVLAWSELSEPKEVYPNGISGALAEHLRGLPDMEVRTEPGGRTQVMLCGAAKEYPERDERTRAKVSKLFHFHNLDRVVILTTSSSMREKAAERTERPASSARKTAVARLN